MYSNNKKRTYIPFSPITSPTMAPCMPFSNPAYLVPSFVDHALQIPIISALVDEIPNETNPALEPLHDAPLLPVHSVHYLPQSLAHQTIYTLLSRQWFQYGITMRFLIVRSCNMEHSIVDSSCLTCILHSLDYGFILLWWVSVWNVADEGTRTEMLACKLKMRTPAMAALHTHLFFFFSSFYYDKNCRQSSRFAKLASPS